MQHHWPVFLAVFADIGGVKPFRQDIVELQRAALPGAPDRVAKVEFQFRAIKGSFVGQKLNADTRGVRGALKLRFGDVPNLVRTKSQIGPQGKLDRVKFDVEVLIDLAQELDEGARLRLDLI